MGKIKAIWQNKWVKFSVVSFLYLLWFVVWSQIWWSIIGLVVIYDLYISKYYQRLFWNKHLEHKQKSKTYKSIAGWVEAIVFAVVVAMLIRTYFVEMYVIPTSSMEKTLLIGDYLGVSKVSYGPKLPNTPLSFPFVHNVNPLNPKQKSYLDWIELPYKRLKGTGKIRRFDVVVFNYPEGDTVALAAPQNNYYQLIRQYGRENILKQSEIIFHPVDKRDNYIKRLIGMPGDTIQVKRGTLYVNGIEEPEREKRQYLYSVTTNGTTIPVNTIKELEIAPEDISYYPNYNTYQVYLTDENREKIKKLPNVTSVERVIFNEPDIDIFPHDTANYAWSVDNFGPLWIPRKGATVTLTQETLPLYERIIRNYEGNELEIRGNDIYINGVKATEYTFNMDYFFMMGDNRHNSLDSRFWGFVPEDHIVGKASFVWFSVDKHKKFPANIRFGRMFRGIN